MSKYNFIQAIENKTNESGLKLNGALSIDLPMDESHIENIFVYEMSYTTFRRKLIALYNVKNETLTTNINF